MRHTEIRGDHTCLSIPRPCNISASRVKTADLAYPRLSPLLHSHNTGTCTWVQDRRLRSVAGFAPSRLGPHKRWRLSVARTGHRLAMSSGLRGCRVRQCCEERGMVNIGADTSKKLNPAFLLHTCPSRTPRAPDDTRYACNSSCEITCCATLFEVTDHLAHGKEDCAGVTEL